PNPLLDVSYKGAPGALIHVTGGPDMPLDEVNRCGELVTESLDADANCIWGARVEDAMKGKVRVMTIITGVQSPYVLGKGASPQNASQRMEKSRTMSRELGIDVVHGKYY
ncbi:MAG: cell division protein FtsZ, partial [Nanoarchaeota archaeon]